jgi:NAD(P)-dependent dehydrogenase (short-subunit alcohol dehydrogenase family)
MAQAQTGPGGDDGLAGRVAVVTGAASGMGKVMALALAEAGAAIAAVDIDQDGLDRLGGAKAFAGGRLSVHPADVARLADCRRTVGKIAAASGRIDILVNCAGVSMAPATPPGRAFPVPFWETLPQGWQRVQSINSSGAYFMARFAVPHMLAGGWGRIINVTTSYDTMLAAGMSAYGAAKSALEAGTVIWARELAGTGVTANVLVPGGATDTPFLPPEARGGPLIAPEVMAAPVRWLASPRSDGITGCRFLACGWDAALSPDRAAAAIRAPAGWAAEADRARAVRGRPSV